MRALAVLALLVLASCTATVSPDGSKSATVDAAALQAIAQAIIATK